MIRFLSSNKINKRLWDECISTSVNGRIYAYSWYLDIVADQWGGLILDDYQAVFPLPFRRKWGVDYVYQPVFTQQLGLFSKVPLSSGLLEDFLNKIPAHFQFVDLNLNEHNCLRSFKIKSEVRHNIEMDILEEYNVLKEKYSTNLKRNLKKAAKAKLTVFENLKPDAVIQLFQKNKGRKLKVFSQEDYSRLIRLVYKSLQQGQAEVWGVYSTENNLCAAAIFIRSHKRISFLFSGSDEYAKKHAALPYLLDAFIESHSGQELVFDFEGSDDKNLARFYLGFGAKAIRYSQINWIRTSFIFKSLIISYLNIRNAIFKAKYWEGKRSVK
ncbi:MAG: GNAT family N-acetyltransferase [Bacteroidales bacterium]|nr:GNAT family N-acetyltransferase [Bacteroidales bacterium]